MKQKNIIPVILCGGLGSRLWPLSQPNKPKQFVSLPGMDFTLLQNTLLRIQESEMLPPIIIVQEEFAAYVEKQANQIDVKIGQIILEPRSNGTAFAAILTALFISEHYGAQSNFLIMPVDHYLENGKDLLEKIVSLQSEVEYNPIIFGIKPDRYEPGYGYVSVDDNSYHSGLYRVKDFFEKPSYEEIADIIYTKECYWNSGMFFFNVGQFLDSIIELDPSIYKSALSCYSNTIFIDNKCYLADVILEEPKSIDEAIIKKLRNVNMSVIKMGWHDIGQFHKVWEVSNRDIDGNFSSGNNFLMDTQDSYIVGNHKPTAVIGLKDIMVVHTEEALLIANKNAGLKISSIYNQCHSKDGYYRPWGGYSNIEKGDNFLIKKLNVMPFQRTSLQRHEKRSEHWIVVDGIASVRIGDEEKTLKSGESAYIPINTVHRISNDHDRNLLMVEVQIGSELSEDDIVRSDDDYGRIIK